MRIITLTEIHRILENTKKESHKAIFLFMYLTGVKIGEAIEIKKRDIIDNNHLKVEGRIVFLDSFIFRNYIGKNIEYFLPFRKFGGIRMLQISFKNVLKKIGLFERWSLDDLRKGFFVRCLAEGKDTSEICYLLGIKNKQFNSLRKIISLNEQVSKKDRDFILKRDNYTCQECGDNSKEIELEIDHIIPLIKGGSNNFNNLQTLCKVCNLNKRDKLLK